MHNRQIMFYRKQSVEESSENTPALSKGSNPKWSRKSHLDRLGPVPNGISCFIWKGARVRTGRRAPRPDPGAAAGHRPPAPADSAAEEAGGAHRRSLRRPGSAPPHRAASAVRVRCPRTKRGPPFGGPLGRSGGEARIRTGGKGFAGLCLTTWPLRRRYEKGRFENRPDACDGADNGARTRDPNLGKVVLYQLSHVRLRVINIRDAAGGRKEFFKDC